MQVWHSWSRWYVQRRGFAVSLLVHDLQETIIDIQSTLVQYYVYEHYRSTKGSISFREREFFRLTSTGQQVHAGILLDLSSVHCGTNGIYGVQELTISFAWCKIVQVRQV